MSFKRNASQQRITRLIETTTNVLARKGLDGAARADSAAVVGINRAMLRELLRVGLWLSMRCSTELLVRRAVIHP